jgi:branched-subunit amino acid ABC-type transport system permease component
MDISVLLLQLLVGLSSGMVTFLMAAGISIVISGMNIINFGQGAFYMLGAFFCYSLVPIVGFWWALLLGTVGVAALGGLAEIILRPVYRKNLLYQMLVTIGLAFILTDIMQVIWGRNVLVVPPPDNLKSSIALLGASIPSYRLFIIGVAIALAIGLWYMFEKTKLGMTFRAIISDRPMVGNLGINVALLFSIMFMVGVGLSDIAGVIMAPVIGLDATGSMSILFGAFTVMVIGGLTSMRGVLFSALIIGVINAFGSMYVPAYYSLFGSILMILVLLIKPSGLFVKNI